MNDRYRNRRYPENQLSPLTVQKSRQYFRFSLIIRYDFDGTVVKNFAGRCQFKLTGLSIDEFRIIRLFQIFYGLTDCRLADKERFRSSGNTVFPHGLDKIGKVIDIHKHASFYIKYVIKSFFDNSPSEKPASV